MYSISLAGRDWTIPNLPFRLVKRIQPILFDVYLAAGGPSMSTEAVGSLEEPELERLAEATWLAVNYVCPAISFAEFLDQPFSVADLIRAFPSVAKAVGLTVLEQ